jgi:hypothetical protein
MSLYVFVGVSVYEHVYVFVCTRTGQRGEVSSVFRPMEHNQRAWIPKWNLGVCLSSVRLQDPAIRIRKRTKSDVRVWIEQLGGGDLAFDRQARPGRHEIWGPTLWCRVLFVSCVWFGSYMV